MIIRNDHIEWPAQGVNFPPAQPIPSYVKLVDSFDENTKGKKYDQGKLRYDLIPAEALAEVVKVLTIGATKYNEAFDEENWRKVDHKDRRYFSALQRHAWAPRMGENYDKESGVHHYAHAITNLLFLLQDFLENNKFDDIK